MATVRIVLDTRPTSIDENNKFSLVLRIGRKTKSWDIPFDMDIFKEEKLVMISL